VHFEADDGDVRIGHFKYKQAGTADGRR
jgi:hypothetical protein